jgi:phosphate-selective porin OprO and OprP
MLNLLRFVLIGGSLLTPAAGAAQHETPATATVQSPELENAALLRARLEALDAQIRILARQIEIDKEQATERARHASQPVAGRSGFSLQSADGSFRVRLGGLLHTDGRFFVRDTERRGTDSFLLRRVRPIVDATIYRQFDVRIMPDFGSGTTALQDAYIDARLRPQFRIRAGKFKAPVGLERLASASELTFIERALPTLLVPNRDIGVMVHGDLAAGRIAYAGGLFNGVADGGSADADIADGKDVVARVFAQPFLGRRDSAWQNLGAGLAVSYGRQQGLSALSTGLPILRTSGQQAFFAYRLDDAGLGPVLADGTHTRVSAQGHYYRGRFGLLAEHVLSTQDVRRAALLATFDNTAWQLAGSWVLTGETPSFRGVAPRTPFDAAAGTWGAVELTARYAALRIDDAAFPTFANPATAASGADAWAAGVNWILNTGVKFQVNVERTVFETAGTTARRPENIVVTRIQFGF